MNELNEKIDACIARMNPPPIEEEPIVYDGPLPADIAPFQLAAHRRSQQLASQLQQSFKNAPVIPLEWRPADMEAEVPVFVPTPAPPPPRAHAGGNSGAGASLFPSVPKGPVAR